MSIVSGLDNSTLISLLSDALGTSGSSSESTTSGSSSSTGSMSLLDTVTLTNSESLLQGLIGSLSSSDKSYSSLLQSAVVLKAVEKADLFSTNQGLAEALTGVSANGTGTTSSSGATDLSSYLASLDEDSLGSLLDLTA